ncbi:MAG: excinuclease ABC subunit UvrC [Proteobacteria bacterium]|nr:excinuclease ABC subunit UvrC [Pseudomonadota bacterium]MBU1649513.1 excinuclease ABC subunit UvrC [Pseudomonadota bacterium]
MLPPDLLASVPHSPGVYLMLDKKAGVLYVGKAKDLRKRLASYARIAASAQDKTTVMLSHVHKVDTLLTRTEKEALILEASLIKKHRPRYNIILRDDKNYPLIKVTIQEEWPRVLMTRRRKKDGARYFGPYASASAMWATLKLLASTFPLRRCKTRQLQPRTRPCLNGQMHNCLAPCMDQSKRAAYQKMVARIIMVLEGQNRDLITSMGQQMAEAARDLEFERAALIRDQIQALSRTLEKQVIVASHSRDQDIFGLARKDASLALAILLVRNGMISGSRTFFLSDPIGDDGSILSQVLNQYYDQGDNLPQEILLPFAPDDKELLSERLSDLRGTTVHLQIPQRGDRMQLIAMANANAGQIFSERENKEHSWQTLADSMVKILHLNRPPDFIECLDISNTSGQLAVGSLVCFKQGEPARQNFRHYKIRTVDTPDDYAMMAEVLERRLKRGLEENDLPDLLMVDGGRGQLGIAIRVAREQGLKEVQGLDLIGIAKEKQEEGEKLYKPGRKNPIILPAHNPVLLFLMRIRDESHRYGVSFHRKLRNKSTLASELDTISGIGPKKKELLLKSLGSLTQIKKASEEQLTHVPGIGPELAREIHTHFREDTQQTEQAER